MARHYDNEGRLVLNTDPEDEQRHAWIIVAVIILGTIFSAVVFY
jgi:hypothetical protein